MGAVSWTNGTDAPGAGGRPVDSRRPAPDRAQVTLARKGSRRHSVAAALGQIADRVRLDAARCVLVKPNFVQVDAPLSATHVDAVRAVLDFVRARYDGPVVVAEGAALAPTEQAFHNYGYWPLVDEYAVELVDLNGDDVVPVQIYGRRLRAQPVYLARTVAEADYRISVGPPKTHDTVQVTLSIKNVVMGALVNPQVAHGPGRGLRGIRRLVHMVPEPVRHCSLAEVAKGNLFGPPRGSSKLAMHQGFPAINLNLALVAPHVWPQLAVIDGWQGMEGAGPSCGDPVDWRIAVAGVDPLAVDVLVASLMGFDPQQIGYLHYCRLLGLGVADLERIDVVTEGVTGLAEVRRQFAPHSRHARQLAWRLDGAERYLTAGVAEPAGRRGRSAPA